jgi:PAS domain S-box-containing protein
MQSAPLRGNEQASLEALRKLEILDTAQEAEFDALARAASLVCNTPISLISLVDADRQWFKANVGLEGVTETPRDVAFCAHAVRDAELFEISDASLDGRFADNPLVAGQPGIRFYAGAPISLCTGERVGTLCVIDRMPRQLHSQQREVLVLLAAAAAKAMEGRRALRLLEEASAAERRMNALIESERTQLRTLLQTIPELVWLKDGAGVYLACNLAFEQLFGARAADIIGKTDYDFMSPALADELRRHDVWAAGAARPQVKEEWATFASDGHRALLETTQTAMRDGQGRLVGVLGIARDITEHRRRRDQLEEIVAERTAELTDAHAAAEAVRRAGEERLQAENAAKMQSRKLEAVGTMAAGMAHEFNNILASIVGYAELAEDDLPDGSEAKHSVGKVISGSFRARDLVSSMLAFARKDPNRPVVVNIVAQIHEALALLRVSLGPLVKLSFQSRLAGVPTIMAEPSQIMQIVMNLCINAADAMDHRGLVSIGIDLAGAGWHGQQPVPAAGLEGVCLTVSDTGTGMSPAVLERMFDPFFTTKAPGRGTGLGMSVVYGIVTGLGGAIRVRSEVGDKAGTEIQVFIPTPSIDSDQDAGQRRAVVA